MTIKSQTTFKTSDGAKFYNKDEAEKHEVIITAQRAYEAARYEWMKAITSTYKTADGYDFSITGSGDYFMVHHGMQGPSIERVSFYVWHCDIDEESNATIIYDNGSGQNRRRYDITKLYKSERCAQAALVTMFEEEIEYFTERMEAARRMAGDC